MKKLYQGTLDIEELMIKRLYVDDIVFREPCPHCGQICEQYLTTSAIYYPKKESREGIWCDDCELEFVLNMKIGMTIVIETEVEKVE